jgi:hyperosmotically inducible periplasmic protein
VIADATADARITTAIKGQYALDSEISALTISVNTTKGVVTLSGTVKSHDHIKKAMQIALQIDGVTEVISTLQVK